jgi:HPt (histidine-containing phosphotransfer) domain-containing protein
MTIPFDKPQPFITLIAHKQCTTLQILQVTNLCHGACVFTGTFDETSTAIASKIFNLIIVDLDLNGIEIVSLARSPGCINCDVPIIALIDSDDLSLRRSLIVAGFDDSLLKPLTATALDTTIKLWHSTDELVSSLQSIETLLATCKNDRNLVLKICNKLFEELPLQISDIDDALKNGLYQQGCDVAHKINGSAKICGLQKIADFSDALEKCLAEKKTAEAKRCFLTLRQHIATLLNQQEAIIDYLHRN